MQFGGTFKKNGYQNLLRRPIEYMTISVETITADICRFALCGEPQFGIWRCPY